MSSRVVGKGVGNWGCEMCCCFYVYCTIVESVNCVLGSRVVRDSDADAEDGNTNDSRATDTGREHLMTCLPGDRSFEATNDAASRNHICECAVKTQDGSASSRDP